MIFAKMEKEMRRGTLIYDFVINECSLEDARDLMESEDFRTHQSILWASRGLELDRAFYLDRTPGWITGVFERADCYARWRQLKGLL